MKMIKLTITQQQRDNMFFLKGLISAQGHFVNTEDVVGHVALWDQINDAYHVHMNEILGVYDEK